MVGLLGITCGGGLVQVSEDERDGMNGRAFSADAVWAVARTWSSGVFQPAVLAVAEDYRDWPSSEQMRVYTSMYKENRNKLVAYLKAIAVDLVMPLLNLRSMMAAHNTIAHQTKAPGYVKAGLGPSADYCVDQQIRDGTHTEVKYDKNFWIYLLFLRRKELRW